MVVCSRFVPASKTAINRCGDVLRAFSAGALATYDWEQIDEALAVVLDFRASFQKPLAKTTVGLRQFVQRESSTLAVAQRLKRLPQVINKLHRLPGTKLARMEDVGGCRAVLANRDEVLGVLVRIKRNWDVRRTRDYAAQPKDTGYRGVHVVVVRDGRCIEIQLRTSGQQDWAEAVERTAGRLRFPLKDGQGPPDLLEYFRLASEGIAGIESGTPMGPEMEQQFAQVRAKVRHYFIGDMTEGA